MKGARCLQGENNQSVTRKNTVSHANAQQGAEKRVEIDAVAAKHAARVVERFTLSTVSPDSGSILVSGYTGDVASKCQASSGFPRPSQALSRSQQPCLRIGQKGRIRSFEETDDGVPFARSVTKVQVGCSGVSQCSKASTVGKAPILTPGSIAQPRMTDSDTMMGRAARKKVGTDATLC